MKKKKSLFRKFLYSQKVAPYVFIAPFIITFLLFFAYSIVSMVIMSFQRVAGPNTTFNGLENYKILNKCSIYQEFKEQYFLHDRIVCADDSDPDGTGDHVKQQADASEDDVPQYAVYSGAYFCSSGRRCIPSDVRRTGRIFHEPVDCMLRYGADHLVA